MRTIYLRIFFIISFLCLIISCTEEFTPAFKENTSQRFQTAKSEYDTILRSAKNGWLLQYFPGKDLKYGGYNYYVNFSEGNKVEVKTELYKSATVGEGSTYAIKQYGGAVLSFDLYNSLMHFFATPSADEYKGKGGDFEFQIISYKDNVMTLQGIKTGNYMRLIKLKETPEEYNKKSEEIEDLLSDASLYDMSDEIKVDIDKLNRHIIFTYNKNQKEVEKSIAFVYTDKGISLYEPFSYNNSDYKEFIFYKNEDRFSSLNGDIKMQVVYPPFNINKKRWVVSLNPEHKSASAEVFRVFGEAQVANNNKYGMIFYPEIDLGLMPNGTIGFRLFTVDPATFGIYPVMYNLKFKGVLGNKNQLDITPVSPGVNWNLLQFLSPFLGVLTENAPYTVEKNDSDNPTEIKLISIDNPEVWYILKEPKE